MSNPSPQTFLNPAQRAHAWERLGSEQFDVVVIGGGIVGAGAALDAATRGLKVALVEARDFASGTSSRSSKMFHGGLRYLEQLEFGLVREALYERELSLTTLAPANCARLSTTMMGDEPGLTDRSAGGQQREKRTHRPGFRRKRAASACPPRLPFVSTLSVTLHDEFKLLPRSSLLAEEIVSV